MSKATPDDTRARLLDRARQLFNERGIDNVGVRELAREMEMSSGNVSYYFAKKEDLVRALMSALRERNAGARAMKGATIEGFLAAFTDALRGQLLYRCLAQSIVHVVGTWPALGEEYRAVDRQRRREMAAQVRSLCDAGELVGLRDDKDVARLVGTWSVVARFWMAERGLSYGWLNDEAAIRHYVALVAHAMTPWMSKSARRRAAASLAGVVTDAALGKGAKWKARRKAGTGRL